MPTSFSAEGRRGAPLLLSYCSARLSIFGRPPPSVVRPAHLLGDLRMSPQTPSVHVESALWALRTDSVLVQLCLIAIGTSTLFVDLALRTGVFTGRREKAQARRVHARDASLPAQHGFLRGFPVGPFVFKASSGGSVKASNRYIVQLGFGERTKDSATGLGRAETAISR
ncbi:hypothetical protein GGX14DRAFT_578236 [Mycena pura]|uniref:Uncharacterized protein n=1 Tax=Mycena pura TaxID=153505 RepID=A0AAD6Y1L0_9AGAR|nr:hypothetical protein GGX14DRAFT_578236 [Mycena pura]